MSHHFGRLRRLHHLFRPDPLPRLRQQYPLNLLDRLDPSVQSVLLGLSDRLPLAFLYSGILDSTYHNPYIHIFHLYYNSYIHIPFNLRPYRTFII